MQLSDPVDALRGIGPARACRLGELGISTVGDLLHYYPKEYILPAEKRRIADAPPGDTVVFDVELRSVRLIRRGWSRSVVEGQLGDSSGTIRSLWFQVPYLARTLRPGARMIVRGAPSGSPPVLLHPSFEMVREGEESEFEGIVPRYGRVTGLPQRILRQAIRQALEAVRDFGEDPLSEEIRSRLGLAGLREAIQAIHNPGRKEEADQGRRRLVFEELFRLQCAFAGARRRRLREGTDHICLPARGYLQVFLDSLPFRLTGDQRKVAREICVDLESGHPMERLLVGDVGSGKTVVAAAAIAHVWGIGGQAALLVPTEVLARQHYDCLSRLLAPLGARLSLLTGDLPSSERQSAYAAARSGEACLVVGTHALLQGRVKFKRLALAVVDEQHRFGVRQRAVLPAKGEGVHFLLLSATPIPRSLALTLYGDLDLSVIRTMPPGRREIATRHLADKERRRAYESLRERLEEGEQGFVLFPLVEESKKSDHKAAVGAARKLADGFFRGFRVGLLHGRLPVAERIETLERFRQGEIDLLVCTTVVEVGIDLPRATVMIVEHADRFGLSQLHQIRGRVGRSDLLSYCFLLTRGPLTTQAEGRLKVLERTGDGFRIAEEDLRLRGPGDLLGTVQHGRTGLGVADLLYDTDLLEAARREAFAHNTETCTELAPIRAG